VVTAVPDQKDIVREVRSLNEDAYLISLSGAFDLHAAPGFERRVLEALGRGATELVIDLSEVSFIDSTTIGILMRTRKRLAPLGGRVLVVTSDRNILRLFEITALDRMFEIYSRRTDALEEINGHSSS
jgi:anti-sigma B factor antagonist